MLAENLSLRKHIDSVKLALKEFSIGSLNLNLLLKNKKNMVLQKKDQVTKDLNVRNYKNLKGKLEKYKNT